MTRCWRLALHLPEVLTWMLLTHSWVMDDILPLLAPGGFSWFSEASCESKSLMMLLAILNSNESRV